MSLLKKTRAYYEDRTNNPLTIIDPSNLRDCQFGAMKCILEKFLDNSNTVSIVSPPRTGKTDMIRLSSLELIERRLACHSIIAAPASILKQQASDKNQIKLMFSRHKTKLSRQIQMDRVNKFDRQGLEDIFEKQNPHWVFMTTQMLVSNIAEICEVIRKIVKATGKRFLIYIDEGHSAAEGKEWGNAVEYLWNSGAMVCLFTGTPYRDDGDYPIIAGFSWNVKNERIGISRVPNKNANLMDIYETTKGKFELEADYEFPYSEAVSQGMVCKLSQSLQDAVTKIPIRSSHGGSRTIDISELSTSDVDKYLASYVTDPRVIDAFTKIGVECLANLRKIKPNIQGIAFCRHDDGTASIENAHANEIRNAILRHNSNAKVLIATSNMRNANAIIKKFCDGDGDWLIVKQMGGVGLDLPSLKVGIDLSTVRKFISVVQRMLRVATINGNMKVGHYIFPPDRKMLAIWQGYVAGAGGAEIVTDRKLIGTEEFIETNTEKSENTFEVIEMKPTLYTNGSDGKNGKSANADDYEQYVKPAIEAFPALLNERTYEELAALLKWQDAKSRGLPISGDPAATFVFDIDAERIKKRRKFNELVANVAEARCSYSINKNEHLKIKKRIYYRARRYAGFGKTKLEHVMDLSQLDKALEYVTDLL